MKECSIYKKEREELINKTAKAISERGEIFLEKVIKRGRLQFFEEGKIIFDISEFEEEEKKILEESVLSYEKMPKLVEEIETLAAIQLDEILEAAGWKHGCNNKGDENWLEPIDNDTEKEE